MGFHHIAVVTKDMPAIDKFYGDVLGFKLVKVEIGPTPDGGFAKHFFYETGKNEFIAFWELHVDKYQDYPTAISSGVGLPEWVNHISFSVDSVEEMMEKSSLWTKAGYDVMEVNHNWCHSVYCKDPNGTLVEFCVTTGGEFTEEDHLRAKAAILSNDLEHSEPPHGIKLHPAE